MKGKKKTIVVLVLLLLVGLTSGYIARTYAKYASEVSKEGKASIAKWNFTKDNMSKTFTIMLNENYEEDTLFNGKIAPGTKGYFDVALTNTSDTGVDYTIKLTKLENVPTNLKLYYLGENDSKNYLTLAEEGVEATTFTGKLNRNQTEAVPVKIYWEWLYESTSDDAATKTQYDEADTQNGLDAAGVKADGSANEAGVKDAMTVEIQITGVQTKPAEITPASPTPVVTPTVG